MEEERVKKKYKHVLYVKRKKLRKWYAYCKRDGKIVASMHFDDEREAALYVDKCLIANGYPPVNILKKK
jgi:hypothetical protein